MSSIKAVLRKKPLKDGSYPIAIRVTKNRVPAYVYIGVSVRLDEWLDNEQAVIKSHPNATRINNLILKKRTEATDRVLEAESSDEHVSTKAIKQKIKPQGAATFFFAAKTYLSNLRLARNYNCFGADKPRIKHFKEFLGGNDIAFTDITVGLLDKYKIYLKAKHHHGDRTIANHLVVIRTIFNQAIRDKTVEEKFYPFGKGKLSIKFGESTKIGLASADVQNLENVTLENPVHDHARNLWLLSYYFAGMRVSDLLRLKWLDFQDERLFYTMGKNKKPGSLRAHDKALAILSQYMGNRGGVHDLIFDELRALPTLEDDFEVQRKISYADKLINKILRLYVAPAAGVSGTLTMHIARHTFATVAADKIPLPMLQKLYRHSDIKTTVGYQMNFIHKDADDALHTVLGM